MIIRKLFSRIGWKPSTKEPSNVGAELARLRSLQRHQPGVSMLLRKPVRFVDSASLLAQFDDIWRRKIYLLKDESPKLILDCGANIGMSALFFSSYYPNTRIVSFEPDPTIYKVLVENCLTWNAANVELVNAAVWTHEEGMLFHSEGADSGGLCGLTYDEGRPVISVPTVRLKNYLESPVDLLKIDIEGAELAVLHDISESLYNVRAIFLEYHSFVGKPQDLDVVLAILKNGGFRVHMDAGLVSSNPFVEISTYNGMDQFINVFAVRE